MEELKPQNNNFIIKRIITRYITRTSHFDRKRNLSEPPARIKALTPLRSNTAEAHILLKLLYSKTKKALIIIIIANIVMIISLFIFICLDYNAGSMLILSVEPALLLRSRTTSLSDSPSHNACIRNCCVASRRTRIKKTGYSGGYNRISKCSYRRLTVARSLSAKQRYCI